MPHPLTSPRLPTSCRRAAGRRLAGQRAAGLLLAAGLAALGTCGDGASGALSAHSAAAARGGQATSSQALRGRHVARVIVLGDSISAGLGASHVRLSYAALLYHNDADAYPQARGEDLRSRFGPDLQYINVAHTGDTTAEVVARQLPRLLAEPQQDAAGLGTQPVHGHTLVIMTIGGNDVRRTVRPPGSRDDEAARRATREQLHAAMRHLEHTISFFRDRTRFVDGASIYLGNVYDVTDGTDNAHACLSGLTLPGLVQGVETWDDAFGELTARQQVQVVDLLDLFHGHGFAYADPGNVFYSRRDPTLWLSPRDCIHPNNRGHDALRRAFFRAVAADF